MFDAFEIGILAFLFLVIIVTFIILFLMEINRRKFIKIAVEQIQTRWPHVSKLLVWDQGLGSMPKIKGYFEQTSHPLKKLQIAIINHPSSKVKLNCTTLIALLQTKLNFEKEFVVNIVPESSLGIVFFGENIVLEEKALDDSFLINSSDVEEGNKYLPYFKAFLLKLSSRNDFISCKLAFQGNTIDFASRFSKTKAESIVELFDILAELINDIKQLERSKEIEEQHEETLEHIVQYEKPMSTENDEKTEITKPESVISNQEIIATIPQFAPFGAEIKNMEEQIEITDTVGFFKFITCKFEDKLLVFEALAEVDERVNISGALEALETSNSNTFDWFQPLSNLTIKVSPKDLLKDLEVAYDILRPFQEIDKQAVKPRIVFTTDNGHCRVKITCQKSKRNIEKAFEIIKGSTWKWLNSFTTI